MIPVKYNCRSLIVRRVGTVMTMFGVALTVAVFVSVLALLNGIENTFVDSGEPLNLIIIPCQNHERCNCTTWNNSRRIHRYRRHGSIDGRAHS